VKAAIVDSPNSVPVYGDFAEPTAGPGTQVVEALVTALSGDAPGLVLDFVWGPVAETAFGALSRRGLREDTADISRATSSSSRTARSRCRSGPSRCPT
jgi:hypothetical protein